MRRLVPGRLPEFNEMVAFSSRARIWGECSTIHSPPELFFSKVEIKKSLRVFLWQPVTILLVCFGKNSLCYPHSGDEGSILAKIILSTSMARPTVAKNQGNQFLQYSDVTNGQLVYFPWNVTLKYKMKLFEGSWDKLLHSKLRTQCFRKEKVLFFLFFSGGFFLEVIDRSSGSSFRDFSVKSTKER